METMTSTPIELPVAALTVANGRTPKSKSLITDAPSPGSSTKEKLHKSSKSENAVANQLTKTKMCCFFERGKCASQNCRYAHSVDELRSAPNLQKTKLCRAFLAGGCNDENCFYAHGEIDLRVTEGIYKTQICNFFERGYCKKGDRCNHAHGVNDLRPLTPSANSNSTPMSKTSSTPTGCETSRVRRSPLPLAELLVDSEGRVDSGHFVNTIPPTPTKSVTELASLAFSPMPSSPLWGQYPYSPVSSLAPISDMCSMWPVRDPVEMLVDQHAGAHMGTATNLLYAMDALDTPAGPAALGRLEQHFSEQQTPEKEADLSPLGTTLLSTEAPRSAPPGIGGAPGLTPVSTVESRTLGFTPLSSSETRAPGLTPMSTAGPQAAEVTEEKPRDPLMLNLNDRLASLDAIVQCLSNDIADIRSDPKTLHRI